MYLEKTKIAQLPMVFIAFILLFILSTAGPKPVQAAISSCTATVAPTSVDSGTTSDFSFSIVNNDSSNSLVWVKITRPSSNFTITGSSSSGATVTTSDVTFSGAFSIGPGGGSTTLSVTATAGTYGASSANWTVQASDDGSGASPTTCTGDLGTSITGPSAVTLSDLVVSEVTSSSVKVSWTTNTSSTSVVDYGTTASYGSTKTDSALVTSHSLTIDGLSANTTYHANAKSTDASSNTGESGDFTFVTAKAGTTTTTTVTVTRTITPTPTPTPIPDKIPPSISISSDLTKPFPVAPEILGKAADPSGVDSLEYSTDDGKNWLPVDNPTKMGATSISFSFTPVGLEDDSYIIKVRAADGKGNSGVSKGHSLVIDRLPPLLGGQVISVGSQVLKPSPDGSVILLAGLEHKLTLSAVGGPTEIALTAGRNTIQLKKNPEHGLWWGTLAFTDPGTYTLEASAIDGAQNHTKRLLTTVTVVPRGTVSSETHPIENASILVYYLEPTTKRYVVWDGVSYGQENPQRTDAQGNYRLLLPPGTYYLEVHAWGFRPLQTSIFSVNDNTPVVTAFTLFPRRMLHIGPLAIPLPDFRQSSVSLDTTLPKVSPGASPFEPLIHTEVPYAELREGDKRMTTVSFRGKPTIFTIFNTWIPQTAAQLAILAELSQKKEINVVGIVPQESASSVSIFQKRGRYTFQILADPDGELIEPFGLQYLPTHVFLSRKGIIQGVRLGIATKEELLDGLIQ